MNGPNAAASIAPTRQSRIFGKYTTQQQLLCMSQKYGFAESITKHQVNIVETYDRAVLMINKEKERSMDGSVYLISSMYLIDRPGLGR